MSGAGGVATKPAVIHTVACPRQRAALRPGTQRTAAFAVQHGLTGDFAQHDGSGSGSGAG
jgi:hypothetical protein